MDSKVLIIVAGAAAATYITRFPLMLISGKKEIPKWLERFMSFIAPAVLTSLIVPAIFIKQGKLDFSLSNVYIIASVITGLVAYFARNMLVTVIAGVCTVGLLVYLL